VAPVQDRMVAAWSRGQPMSERLHPPPGAAGDAAADEAAGRRLRRWRQQEPFGDRAVWDARLRADGIDEATLRQLLAEPADALARRLATPEWAAWTAPDPAADAGGPPAPVPTGAGEPEPFFARAARPLLDTAYARLQSTLVELAASHPATISPQPLVDQLFPVLTWRFHAMLIRTLTLELHLARLEGHLPDGPEQRFGAFLSQLDDPCRRERLIADYPVLGRQLWLAAEQWVANGVRMAERIVADHDLIARHFAGGRPIGPACQIRPGAGDRHQGGQSVAIVGFDSGLALVYKPRSMAIDAHFVQLLEWLNAAGLSLPLRAPACLDRGGYGWAELITPRLCEDQDGVRRFYRRQGSLLGLLELLRANDVHAENLIAAGEHPIVVDLETLLQPQLPLEEAGATTAERRAEAAALTSVLQVGLLPTLAWPTRDGHAVDISGLGNRPGQQTPMGVPVLADIGTDAMRVRLQRLQMDLPDHRPVPKDTEVNLIDYADDLTAGYAEMHELCRRRRDELLADDGPLARFRGDRVRVVLRSTVVYATVLATSFHPDVLRDGLERDRHFDFLWRRVADTPAMAAVVPAERRDLWRGDVPIFTGRADSPSLFDSDGQPVAGLVGTSGLDLVRTDLATRDDHHLSGQLALIRGSLAAAAINATGDVVSPSYRLPQVDTGASVDELVAAAEAIGAALASQAYVADGSAQWLGLSSNGGRDWGLGPLGPDLFNGLLGVALFLAELGGMSSVRRHTDLARQAVVTVRSQLARDPQVSPAGMAGLPGIVYGLCRLAELLDDRSLLDRAVAVAADLRGSTGDDHQYDIVSGSAGTIAAMRILHAMRPDSPAVEVIAAAADRLRTTVQSFPAGCGWLPASIQERGLASVPLAGFGHGNAGIAWALAHAAAVLGQDSYAELARDAVAYEGSLFDPVRGVWRDMRRPDQPVEICAWCHGAVGIGLARLDSPGSNLGHDIDAALAAARSDGFGVSHCLCHGDTGAVDLFLTASRVLGRPRLRDEANLRAAQILASIRADGEVCGVPFGSPTPSLMVGLAGIGYGLLRVAAPDRLPSVLLLEPTATCDVGSVVASSDP
jgi:type 2 lantibiotic biosynthesis protein LanM